MRGDPQAAIARALRLQALVSNIASRRDALTQAATRATPATRASVLADANACADAIDALTRLRGYQLPRETD